MRCRLLAKNVKIRCMRKVLIYGIGKLTGGAVNRMFNGLFRSNMEKPLQYLDDIYNFHCMFFIIILLFNTRLNMTCHFNINFSLRAHYRRQNGNTEQEFSEIGFNFENRVVVVVFNFRILLNSVVEAILWNFLCIPRIHHHFRHDISLTLPLK